MLESRTACQFGDFARQRRITPWSEARQTEVIGDLVRPVEYPGTCSARVPVHIRNNGMLSAERIKVPVSVNLVNCNSGVT